MTYKEATEYLFSALPMYQQIGSAAYKADLSNAYLLDDHFEHPHRKFKTIHVAGTNGKGSVSHMLASVFQSAGYRTGLYTSPHLLDFRERIKVDGETITEEFVTDFTFKNGHIFERIKPSFFEMTVFLAFEYFAFKHVDFAIIEVGLGGRLDTTNIISPILSIITNIGYDHMQFLGNTLTEIASEKAGIIKENTKLVVGETQQETRLVFKMKAEEKRSKIYFADEHYIIDYSMITNNNMVAHHFSTCFYWNFISITLDLKGSYQKKNLATCLMALSALAQEGIPFTSDAIKNGLSSVISSTGLLGRWQETGYNPLVICDTAHNAEGIKLVVEQINNTAYKILHMVLGFVSDKDISAMVSLLPKDAYYYLCRPVIPRGKEVSEVKATFDYFNLNSMTFSKVEDAFHYARQKTDERDIIYIGGSTYVVADFLKWKKEEKSF